MNFLQLLGWVFAVNFLICAFAGIAMTYYIGRRHIKEVDRVALGCEIKGDSIFYQMLRIPNYTLAFIWPLYAKRGGLQEICNRFDKKFKRPFVIHLWLAVVSVGSLVIGILLDKYYIHLS